MANGKMVILTAAFLTCVLISYWYHNGSPQYRMKALPAPASHVEETEFTVDDNILYIRGAKNLPERIELFDKMLSKLRLKQLESKPKYEYSKNVTKVVWGRDDDYISQLGRLPQFCILALSWIKLPGENASSSLQDSTNLVVQKYHKWSGSRELCRRIQKPGGTNMNYDVVHHRHCDSNITETLADSGISFLALNQKPVNRHHYWPPDRQYPEMLRTNPPGFIHSIYILRNAYITGNGDVISGGVKFVPYTCGVDISAKLPGISVKTPEYDEVFVITQYWNVGWHTMAEMLPRLAFSLKFLQDNTNIKIHYKYGVNGPFKFNLELLGVNVSRIITGVIKAKIVYQPQGSYCGFNQVPAMQLLSRYYLRALESLPQVKQITQKHVLLLQRNTKRRFINLQKIRPVVEQLAKEFGVPFMYMDDTQHPAPVDFAVKFNRALLVVAPHGSGLSNVVYSSPGLYVVEGVCNPPHINLCFQRLAHTLGHYYHGVLSRRGCEGSVDPPVEEISEAVKAFLKHARDTGKLH